LDVIQSIFKILNRYVINHVESSQRLLDISLSKDPHLPEVWHRHAKHFVKVCTLAICMYKIQFPGVQHVTFKVRCITCPTLGKFYYTSKCLADLSMQNTFKDNTWPKTWQINQQFALKVFCIEKSTPGIDENM